MAPPVSSLNPVIPKQLQWDSSIGARSGPLEQSSGSLGNTHSLSHLSDRRLTIHCVHSLTPNYPLSPKRVREFPVGVGAKLQQRYERIQAQRGGKVAQEVYERSASDTRKIMHKIRGPHCPTIGGTVELDGSQSSHPARFNGHYHVTGKHRVFPTAVTFRSVVSSCPWVSSANNAVAQHCNKMWASHVAFLYTC